MHRALYRKWRPERFSDVCGQEHITSILKQEATLGKFNHAYLFCGSRGTGKTTCAKILAKVVNCENVIDGEPCGKCRSCLAIENGGTTDVLEMDAASNNSVNDIRDIRDEVLYTPSLLKYRVYIVDEVHMLSSGAFNALLKTLEEPPSHAIFILATTELHKLPATIVSRCQRFEFRRIATDTLTARIKYIAENEKIEIDDSAARLIARYSQGGMRDSISLLELCASRGARITLDTVNQTIGSAGREAMMAVAEAVIDKNFEFLFEQIDRVVSSSMDIEIFWQDLISLYRDILVLKTVKGSAKYLDLSDYEEQRLADIAGRLSKEALMYQIRMLEETLHMIKKNTVIKRVAAEVCFVKLCDESLNDSNEALLLRITKLEDKLSSGAFVASATAESKQGSAAEPKKQEKKTPVKAPEIPAKQPDAAAERPQRAASAPKALRAWPEVVQKIAAIDPGAHAFLKRSRAYLRDDGKLRAVVPQYSLFAIDKPEIKEALANALSRHIEGQYQASDIVFEEYRGEIAPEIDDLDDILNNN